LSIRIYYDEVIFRLKGSRSVLKKLDKVVTGEKKITGNLSYIITSDENLKQINIEFLEHDYFTDVITFNYNEGNIINGEIYISIDRVRENSENYKVSLQEELLRVIIHGLLHLTGYDDKTDFERREMRSREDYWLDLFR